MNDLKFAMRPTNGGIARPLQSPRLLVAVAELSNIAFPVRHLNVLI